MQLQSQLILHQNFQFQLIHQQDLIRQHFRVLNLDGLFLIGAYKLKRKEFVS